MKKRHCIKRAISKKNFILFLILTSMMSGLIRYDVKQMNRFVRKLGSDER